MAIFPVRWLLAFMMSCSAVVIFQNSATPLIVDVNVPVCLCSGDVSHLLVSPHAHHFQAAEMEDFDEISFYKMHLMSEHSSQAKHSDEKDKAKKQ